MQWCRGRLGTDANLPADAPARLHGGPNAFHQPPHSHGITAPDGAGHMRRTNFFSKRLGMGKNLHLKPLEVLSLLSVSPDMAGVVLSAKFSN
jgi:hypothetical protein